MNIILPIFLSLILSSFFIISPVWSDKDQMVVSEIDGNLFTALMNSTVIYSDGSKFQKLELTNAEKIGEVIILEEKSKDTDTWKFDQSTIFGIVSGIGVGVGVWRFWVQRKDSVDMEFNKLLNDFEKQWTHARTDWKNNTSNTDELNTPDNYNNCFAMCAKRLSILDTLAFLSTSNRSNKKMLNYFQYHFREGKLYDKWIADILTAEAEENNVTPSGEPAWRNFTRYVKENNIPFAPTVDLENVFHIIYEKRVGKIFTIS